MEQASIDGVDALFSFRNLASSAEGATVTANLTGTNRVGKAENLLKPGTATPFQTTSISANAADARAIGDSGYLSIRIAFPRVESVQILALVGHNSRFPWRVRLYASTAQEAKPFKTTGWYDPIIRASPDDFSFSGMRWSLGPKARHLESMQARSKLISYILLDREYHNVHCVEYQVDTSQADDEGSDNWWVASQASDFIRIGQPFAGTVFRPRINILQGVELQMGDKSVVNETERGDRSGRERKGKNSLTFTLGYLDRDELYEEVIEHFDNSSLLRPMLAILEPAQKRYFYRTSMLGYTESVPASTMAYLDWAEVSGWRIIEA